MKTPLLLLLLFSQVSLGSSLNFKNFSDEIGMGSLTKGILGESSSLVEKDLCVFREQLSNQNSQVIEFDFLGFTEVFPSSFDMGNTTLRTRQEGENTFYIRSFPERSRSFWAPLIKKYVCDDGEEPLTGGIELGTNGQDQVSITWKGTCLSQKDQKISRFYQMTCVKEK